MKNNRFTLIAVSLVLLVALALSACGPKEEPGPVTLTVSGLVDKPLSLTDADLHDMNVITATVEHPKDGPTEYTGVLLNDLLADAGVQSGATTVTLVASDGYSYDLELTVVQECSDCMIAFMGEAGDYMSAIPGQSGKAWVKGLVSIEVK
jgi:hypothetical protein